MVKYLEFVWLWYECVMMRQCIVFEGFNCINYWQDQVVFMVLVSLSKNECSGVGVDLGRQMDYIQGVVGMVFMFCYEDF